MRPVPYGGRSTTPSGTSPQGDAGALAKFLVSYFWMVNAVALIILKYVEHMFRCSWGCLRGVGLTPLQVSFRSTSP